ncbi:SDR family NAD(P)-dependent oxidoreductase [Vallitalea okinawensis]|uniref:SDR family NAD(P)-dependent oxidoreductase n=1 Tax=Vallitalea okinawensis TaxID=2078660 RepID=UPI000CFCF2B5|nr:SDR family oxidoreductase [Vallitalea okinawensis]
MKKILITGAGTGLGKALALSYAIQGHQLILIGRRLEALLDVVKDIVAKGGTGVAISCDISNQKSVSDLRTRVEKEFGTIDILVNNAGIGFFGPFEKLTSEELRQMIDVNIMGTIAMTQAFIDIIDQRVLNIISTAGLRGKVNEAVYVASKFAIRGFTESLQKEYEDQDLIITAVYMGGMATPFWNHSDHIKDKGLLKNPLTVAKKIVEASDDTQEIFIDC